MTTQAASAKLAQASQLLTQGQYTEAEQIYMWVLKNTTDASLHSAATYGLGLLHLKSGDESGAYRQFLDALQFDGSNANACHYLGVLARRAGNGEVAKTWFARAIVANPKHQGALAELCRIGQAEGVSGSETTSAPEPRQVQSPPSAPTARALPPHKPSSPSAVIGIARQVRQQVVPWRGKPAAMTQLTCRVETYSHSGEGPLGLISVELRSHEVHGTLVDGDWVELTEADATARKPIKNLINLSTGENVYSKYRVFGAR
ncbi:tetratricopeptide repeat protein [Kitasatospora sp. NPDC096128]|uniref:tetratricopeptide repeat protein n=1 Tax=Kitasatospora sp. NPDC096128 TaxID=3155547 RepID=UPI003326CB1C